MSKIGVRDDRDLGVTFIHSVLDDYGLDPYEFRIYCHIARRAGKSKKSEGKGCCWESIANIATNCNINIKTARKSLAFLEDRRLVNVEKRPGYTSIIILNSVEDWLPCDRPTPVKNGSTTKSGTTKSGRGVLPNQGGLPLPNQGGLPLPNLVHEVNPYEDTPNEVNPNKENTPLTPQGEFCVIADEIPFSDRESENLDPEIWDQENQDSNQSSLAKSEFFREPAQQSESSGVDKFSAAAKKTKPTKLEISQLFEAFRLNYNELMGDIWARCDKENPDRLRMFTKILAVHKEALFEDLYYASIALHREKWATEKGWMIDTVLRSGSLAKYAELGRSGKFTKTANEIAEERMARTYATLLKMEQDQIAKEAIAS